jgi:hypothetical protein
MSIVRRSALKIALAGAVVAAFGGCTDLSTNPDVPLGRVTVAVTDETNAGVGGLLVELLRPDRITIWRSVTTNSNGTGEFDTANGGVIPQSYIVRLNLGTQWLLHEGETNDKPVTVVVDQIHPITFKVKKKTVGGGPG